MDIKGSVQHREMRIDISTMAADSNLRE